MDMEIDDQENDQKSQEAREMKKARINRWLEMRKMLSSQIEQQVISIDNSLGRVERKKQTQSIDNVSSEEESEGVTLDLNTDD